MYATLAVSSLLLAAPVVLAQSTGTGSCTDVHIFIARGWNEDYPGRNGKLVNQICADLPDMSCDYEDVAYDAWSTDYCPNVAAGSILAKQQVEAYYAKCPNTKIVLSGYSEGATIMGDLLAGDANIQPHAGCADFVGLPQNTGASCNIAAAMIFGDPKHAANQPYNYIPAGGSAGQADAHTAAQLAILDSYTPRLRSYCNLDDLVCAKGLGADTVEAHTNYFDLYTENAAAWAADLVKAFQPGLYCPLPTTSTSTVTSTASSTTLTTMTTVSKNATTTASTASTSSVALTTVTQLTSVYTTVCPQTSIYTAGNMTKTSTWTGPSTISSIISSSITTTVPGTFVPTSAPGAPTSATTINGSPAVVTYSTSTSTTTLWNFPTITVTKVIPVATSYSNGVVVTGGAGSGGWGAAMPTGTGSPSGTGVKPSGPSGSPIAPYTGAANSLSAVGGLFGVVVAAALML